MNRFFVCGARAQVSCALWSHVRTLTHSAPILRAPKVRSSLGGTVSSSNKASQRRQANRASSSSSSSAPAGGAHTNTATSASSNNNNTMNSGSCGTSRAKTGSTAKKGNVSHPDAGNSDAGEAKPLPGRFNRIVRERGPAFALYLYGLGEGLTWIMTYLLHTHALPIGDVGTWTGLLIGHDTASSYLNIGPSVFGIQLSPRLLLNYLVCTVCIVPLYSAQYAFCAATAPILSKAFRAIAPQRRQSAIPKAPSATAK